MSKITSTYVPCQSMFHVKVCSLPKYVPCQSMFHVKESAMNECNAPIKYC